MSFLSILLLAQAWKAFSSPATPQSALDVCVSDITRTYHTSLAACTQFQHSHNQCFTIGPPKVDTPAFKRCICNQKYFDLIINCQSETRHCLESIIDDSATEIAVFNWHAECDAFIDFVPTTPSLYQPTPRPRPTAICSSIEQVCLLAGLETKSCKSEYGLYITDLPRQPKLESCLCKPYILSAASACLYDGNITCERRPATLSSIDLWASCPKSARPTPIPRIRREGGDMVAPLTTGGSG